jgi:protein-tyrosine-phosphatase
VASAGVRAGAPDPFVTAVMDEIGIDVSQHNPNTLHDLHDTSFDLIITLSPEAHHQALELTRTMAVDVEYWPTLDVTMMAGQGSREQMLLHYRGARPAVRQDQEALRLRGRSDGVSGSSFAAAGEGGLRSPSRNQVSCAPMPLMSMGPRGSNRKALPSFAWHPGQSRMRPGDDEPSRRLARFTVSPHTS